MKRDSLPPTLLSSKSDVLVAQGLIGRMLRIAHRPDDLITDYFRCKNIIRVPQKLKMCRTYNVGILQPIVVLDGDSSLVIKHIHEAAVRAWGKERVAHLIRGDGDNRRMLETSVILLQTTPRELTERLRDLHLFTRACVFVFVDGAAESVPSYCRVARLVQPDDVMRGDDEYKLAYAALFHATTLYALFACIRRHFPRFPNELNRHIALFF